MARKRRKGGRRRRRGTGSIITVRQLSGAERLNNPSSVTGALVPGLLGGGAAILTAVGIRQWVQPTADNQALRDNADLVGLGTGSLVGLALANMASKPAGVAAFVAAAMVTLAERLPMMLAGAMSAMPASNGGTGAIVTETVSGMRRRRGTGAVVMQPAAPGSYGPGGGESVRLSGGMGRLNLSTFGQPTFQMGR